MAGFHDLWMIVSQGRLHPVDLHTALGKAKGTITVEQGLHESHSTTRDLAQERGSGRVPDVPDLCPCRGAPL